MKYIRRHRALENWGAIKIWTTRHWYSNTVILVLHPFVKVSPSKEHFFETRLTNLKIHWSKPCVAVESNPKKPLFKNYTAYRALFFLSPPHCHQKEKPQPKGRSFHNLHQIASSLQRLQVFIVTACESPSCMSYLA